MAQSRASGAAPAAAQQPSRLQRRRPASLQITRPSSSSSSPPQWNVAIPLLSPLSTSPPAIDLTAPPLPQTKSSSSSSSSSLSTQQQRSQGGAEAGKLPSVTMFKRWQHPAAPFCYEPAPFAPSFFVPCNN